MSLINPEEINYLMHEYDHSNSNNGSNAGLLNYDPESNVGGPNTIAPHDYPHHHLHHPINSSPPRPHNLVDNLIVSAEASLAGSTGHGLLSGKIRKAPVYTRSYANDSAMADNNRTHHVFTKKGI